MANLSPPKNRKQQRLWKVKVGLFNGPCTLWYLNIPLRNKKSISKKILNQKINQQMNKMGKRGNWDNLKEV